MSKFTLNSFNDLNSPNSFISSFTKLLFILFTSLLLLTGCSGSDDDSDKESYTVTFVDDDDKIVSKFEIKEGESLIVPSPTPKQDRTFIGWQEVDGYQMIPSDKTYYTPTKNIIFKAQYLSDTSSTYTVIFIDDNDDIILRDNVTKGDSINVPTPTAKIEHTFTHYQEMGLGGEKIPNTQSSYTPTKDIIFKAIYTPILYTVNFIDDNDDPYIELKGTKGETVAVPTPPVKQDYTFTHWQDTQSSQTIQKDVHSYTITKDITFKANYSPIIYTIKFLDDNDDLRKEINASIGQSIPVPTPPDKTGYTFTSWIEVGGTERIENSATTYIVKRGVTFKARYNINTYTVAFLYENGTIRDNQTVAYNSIITVPNAPDKPYYTFVQWKEVGGTETIQSNTNSYVVTRSVNFKPEYLDTFDGTHIYIQENLNKVRDNLSGNYVLMNDIALDENGAGYDTNGWLPIGATNNRFTGTFDGNGHKIIGLWIDRPTTILVGLFGFTQNATIKNLGVEISDRGIKGDARVGGIAGQFSDGTLDNSYSVASVGSSGISGSNYVGGIAGYANSMTMTNIYSAVSVNGGTIGWDYGVGGIVGTVNSVKIINSYSTGSVSGGNGSNTGGIVGITKSSDTVITNSAAINPSVTGNNSVNRIVGNMLSGTTPIVLNNFALDTMTVTGTTNGYAGTDKTATELRTQSTYSDPINGDGLGGLGWKFGNDDDNPWKMDPTKNDGLPYLYWENR
jgi:uncharacterized repeat protein (TIGR02543 family)